MLYQVFDTEMRIDSIKFAFLYTSTMFYIVRLTDFAVRI